MHASIGDMININGGTRFVPIVSAITYLIVGISMFYIWPHVQAGINAVGAVVIKAGEAFIAIDVFE